MSRHCEREAYTHRYLAIQPNLDESQWDVHGRLAGADGRIVEKALHDRGDELRGLPGGSDFSRGQITADALVALAQDSVGDHGNGEATGGGAVSVFVDAAVAGEAKCEAGVVIEYGPRVGPAVLEELLCTGAVQIIGLEEGRPVVVSDAAKAVPVAVRRAVAARDGGCTADGCTSRYRLEPHHIAHRQHGGGHAADNLTTLCWFHHHVVVHGSGFSIHPDYVPGRLRFTRFSRNRAPPPDWQ